MLYNVLVMKGEKVVRHVKGVMKERANKVYAHYQNTHLVEMSISVPEDVMTEGTCKGMSIKTLMDQVRQTIPK